MSGAQAGDSAVSGAQAGDSAVSEAVPGLAPVVLGLATFRDLCLDVVDPTGLGPFWATVLGRSIEDAGQGDGVSRDVFLRAVGDGGPDLYLNGVAESKAGKNRMHLDVTLREGQELTDLIALGATVVTEPGEQRWWVLADPADNEFCAFLPETVASNDADAEVPLEA